jgi:hypothetical protein
MKAVARIAAASDMVTISLAGESFTRLILGALND